MTNRAWYLGREPLYRRCPRSIRCGSDPDFHQSQFGWRRSRQGEL